MEPQTTAKVVLKTTKGPIEAELFAKEVPQACTRFLQLCKAGYYDSKPFYRVLPGELIQCGQQDPGSDTNSYPKLKDEPHTRIKLKRGYLAMASEYTDNNRRVPNSATTEFFVALKEIPFSGTVIGKITGDTLYNAQDIARGELTEDGYPMYVQKILNVDVVLGGGLVEETQTGEETQNSRDTKAQSREKQKKPKRKLQVTHDEDEEEEPVFTKKSVSKLVEDKFKSNQKKVKIEEDKKETEPEPPAAPAPSTNTRHVQDEEEAAEDIDNVVSERLEKFKNMAREKPQPKEKSVLISREDRIRRRLGLGPDDDVPSDASDPSSDEDDDDFDIFKHKFICPEDEKGEDSLVTLGA
ncbi:Peptidyl-prolyl isomerase CWC27 [Yarrowia sp. C11]|nr:Peptidyl-prolyl isomerase CWC27 [Yarrowia sp. E02]KAG5369840.1 Peptidyl-prolyl isomerase CWC27 [Yarrowia sp. C11]